MARARRQPPLFEVLHEPSRRGGAGGSALSPGTGLRPVQVTPSGRRREAEEIAPEPMTAAPAAAEPAVAPERAAAGGAPWWAGEWGIGGQKGILLGIALVMVLVSLTWVIAFKQGERNTRAKLNLTGEEAALSPRIADPMLSEVAVEPDGGSGPSQQASSVQPTRPQAERAAGTTSTTARWQPGTDPREPAHNYLVIATMNYRAAEAMAQFLTEHGVPAAAVPESEKVDPKRAMANNEDHEVIALEGFASGEFSATKPQRAALKDRVAKLGELWRKTGGTEDLSKTYWKRYK